MNEQNGYNDCAFQEIQQYQPPRPMGWYNAYKIISLIFGIIGCIGLLVSLASTVIFAFLGNVSVPLPDSDIANAQAACRVLNIIMLPSLVVSIVSVILSFTIYGGLSKYRKSGLIAIYIEAGWNVLAQLLMIPLLSWFFNELMHYSTTFDTATTLTQNDINVVIAFFTGACIVGALINAALYTLNVLYFRKRKDVFK